MFVTKGKQYSRYIAHSCKIAWFFFLTLADITQWLQMTPSINNKLNSGKHSMRYLGLYLWRKLPGNVRTQCDLNIFKRQIKKLDLESFLLEKCPTGCFLCHS